MVREKTPTKKHSKKKGKFNPGLQTAFLEALVARRGNVTGACETSDVSKSQVYQWLKKDAKFKKRYADTRKQLEEFLFETVCNLGIDEGDTTALIFSLKALNRARFDDAYARQERMLEKGQQPLGTVATPIHVELVRGPGPEDGTD